MRVDEFVTITIEKTFCNLKAKDCPELRTHNASNLQNRCTNTLYLEQRITESLKFKN